MNIPITKPIKPNLLVRELEAVFPGLQKFWLEVQDEALTIRVPDGVDPQAVETVLADHNPQSQTKEEKLREAVKTLAQSAVGTKLTDLTAAQVRALLAILLVKVGAVDPDTLTVNPLDKWV